MLLKILMFLMLVSVSLSSSAYSLVSGAAAGYIEQAEKLALHERSQWLALLHYREEALTSKRLSQADDARFFLSPQGKYDPKAELRADLAAFFKASARGHAQCLFPARWSWLKQQLDIDTRYDVVCPRFDSWLEAIKPDSLTLVFPAMYLNNPGSSYGHTFIRFDNHSTVLLSHALNYAALYDPQDSTLTYSWKGISGGYNGIFSLRRYFETVQEYSNLENRDIWEYRLDYSQREIDLLLRHMWEVLDIDFQYYFFTENCSYRLLALLDVMREGSSLAARKNFRLYAIPVDTVRELRDAGIIESSEYRPSLVSQIDATIGSMDDASAATAIALTRAELTPEQVSDENKAVIFDLAIDILEFQQQAQSETSKRLLLARSKLQQRKREVHYEVQAPETGHASARVGLSLGKQAERNQQLISLRPSFHDLLDDGTGFIDGAEINILPLQLSVLEDEGLELDELVFIDMQSLPALRSWYRPISWSLDIRLQRHLPVEFGTASSIHSLQFRIGAGATLSLLDNTSRLYSLLQTEVNLQDELDDNYSAKLGVHLGWLSRLPDQAGQLLIEAERMQDVAGQAAERQRLSLGYQYDFGDELALRLKFERSEFNDVEIDQWSTGLLHYF